MNRLRQRILQQSVAWMEKQIERRSPIGTGPFFTAQHFAWSGQLEEHWLTIRQELDRVLEYRDDLPNFQDISRQQRGLTNDDQWKTFFFYGYGIRFAGNCERCPETAKLLDHIPGLTTAFFSVLGPHKHLPEHRGPYKGVVRYHLALRIPSPEDACGIRVGGETARWTAGQSLLFDDTYLHEAWNDTDEDRVVLFMDVVHPMPIPYAWLNRLILRSIARSPSVKKAKDAHDAWEQRFEEIRRASARA